MSELWVPPSARSEYKKAPPPKLGDAFGPWAGADQQLMQLPGGGVLQFDLSKLTLADFRSMRDHYQINASMSVLSFMVHQAEWRIVGSSSKINNELDDMIRPVWSRLIRATSQAYWAGYAPTVVQWENDLQGKRVIPTKFMDLVPEHSSVNWKKVNGWAPEGHAPPKINVFDGIKRLGQAWPVPVDNTLWYPLLMENGDYYGKKLLRSAFPSWFFSILLHLFANRYFERFGEPVPIGRADYEADVQMGDKIVSGKEAMETILRTVRNRSVVVLPSDRIPIGDGSKSEYAFDIEYLESQMRGADFERYMDRLDEEMSLGLFTPVLLLRTADVGSYNLGVGHMQMYMWMLNAILSDLADYVNPYLIKKAKDINFGPNAPEARIEFKPMGKQDAETLRAILTSLMTSGKVKPDIDELGQAVGLTLSEVKEVTEPPADPNDTGNGDGTGTPPSEKKRTGPRKVDEPRATTKKIAARLEEQVVKAYREGQYGRGFTPRLGFRRQFVESLLHEGADYDTSHDLTDQFFGRVQSWMDDIIPVGRAAFSDADAFMAAFKRVVEVEVEELAAD